jgi:hypothetical protein
MQPPIDSDGYQRVSIFEGEAPFLMSKVTNYAGVIIVKADIATIKATIVHSTLTQTVLDQSTLAENTVWFDTYQTLTDADGDTVTYNFGWQTTATWFTATTYDNDCQFKVEVWVTPESGQPFRAGGWLVTAKRSIVPIPT